MKTTMRHTIFICLLALGAMQMQAVNYNGTYKGHSMPSTYNTVPASPTISFQSTSAYASQWSSDGQESLLNVDGSVNSGAYMTSGPRKAGPGGTGTPGGDLNPEEQQPLGDALLPLLLLAIGYVVYMVRRRNRMIP